MSWFEPFASRNWRRRLLDILPGHAQASAIWKKHRPHGCAEPDCFVEIGDGKAEFRGVVIGGERDTSLPQGWDLEGRIVLFTDDHEVIVIAGWRATDLSADRSCFQDHLTQETVMTTVVHYADLGVARLAFVTDLAEVFARSAPAAEIWTRHLRRSDAPIEEDPPIPQTAVRLYERVGCPLGLVIDGRWERGLETWDLSYPATLLLSTGEITETHGCLAEGIEEL